jgi:hypothetical protein
MGIRTMSIQDLTLGLVETAKRIAEDSAAYKKFFNDSLKKFGVTSPEELSAEKKKEFYNHIDANWNSDDEPGSDGKKDKPKKDVDEGKGMPPWLKKGKKDDKDSEDEDEVKEEKDDEDEEDEEEVEEGKLPPALQKAIDKKKGKDSDDEDEDEVKEDAVARAKDVEALKKKHADEKKRETDEIERTKDKQESVELDANLLERVLKELNIG